MSSWDPIIGQDWLEIPTIRVLVFGGAVVEEERNVKITIRNAAAHATFRTGNASGVCRGTKLLSQRKSRFFRIDFDPLLSEVETHSAKKPHVHVRYPDQRESGEQIPPPVGKQKLEARNDEKGDSDVVAEAVFAGKEIEELTFGNQPACFALPYAVFTKFPNDLFMRNGPRDGCDWNSDDEQI
jgi:hypothetical protein